MRHPILLSFGEVLWDLFPEGPRFGGAPANFACHAAVLGGNVTMLSAVGRDSRGGRALDILRSFGIDTTLIQQTEQGPTGEVRVTLNADGCPSFVIEDPAAWDFIDWPDAVAGRLNQINAVYFGTLAQRHEKSRTTLQHLLAAARSREIHRVLDVNLRLPFYDESLIKQSVAECSVLKLSDEELPDVARACSIPHAENPLQALRALREQNQLALVAMTRGANGAVLVSESETVEHPGIATEVIDTVGAGDAFAAALVIGLIRGVPLERIIDIACKTAAEVCAQAGAVPDLGAN